MLYASRSAVAIALGASAIFVARPARPQAAPHDSAHHAAPTSTRQSGFRIPESVRLEHTEIHEALTRATRVPGAPGAAARELAAVLDPHFVREEQIALPPLALLAPLSRGELRPGDRAVLAMTDSLRAELPRMLEEHRRIGAAARKLEDVARRAKNAPLVELATKLQLHARSEEEIFYPAAILVGVLVRSRAGAGK